MPEKRLAPIMLRAILGAWIGVSVLAVSSCASVGKANIAETTINKPVPASIPVTVYKTAGCDCCSEHAAYLEIAGFQVTATYIINDSIREKFSVPLEMQSCHITIIDGYYVEGHVPVAAIEKLLGEKPDIDGIVLPGMPSGSPGMPGEQVEEFVIYALKGRTISEFMRIGK